uniref:Uncharacterized protein n=1 Tax=Anopheles quadriannulatus TaxID=34691 RepID=A0A182XRL5_ANOQN
FFYFNSRARYLIPFHCGEKDFRFSITFLRCLKDARSHTQGDTPERKVRKPSRAPRFRRSYTASAALHDALQWMFPLPLWEGEGKLSLGGMSTLFLYFLFHFT